MQHPPCTLLKVIKDFEQCVACGRVIEREGRTLMENCAGGTIASRSPSFRN